MASCREEKLQDDCRQVARDEDGPNRRGLISYLVRGNTATVHYVTVNSVLRIRRARVER